MAGDASASSGNGYRRIRRIGGALLLALCALTWWQAPWSEQLQAAWFDGHQMLAPRKVHALPVTVVAIDQKSLQAIGQWPWPRTELARLVNAINRADPSAIALDILMPEADSLSPGRLLARAGIKDAAIVAALQRLPSNDAELAYAIAAAPTVMALAGTDDVTGMTLRAAPIAVGVRAGSAAAGAPPTLLSYTAALTSVDQLDRQGRGWGLISVDPSRGLVRRIPLVASIGGTLVPALSIEMLRVAIGVPGLRLAVKGGAVESISVGDLRVPTEPDGAVRVYFSPHRPDRFVSAIDVLEGRVDASELRRQMVLIGPTATGLNDNQATPLGERMAGSEIHAQLVENLIDGTLLHRPTWAPAVEALWLLLLGAALLHRTQRMKPGSAAALVLGAVALSVAAAFALFRSHYWLFDAATPGLSLLLLFAVLGVLMLGASTRQRKALQAVVQVQREQSARIAGELEAAQRIQMGSLPRLDLLQGDARIELFAALTPAREVGGDLYDFFRLDADRLFLVIGDVAGKGLSASIFMAVSKALYKSAMLRAPGADIGQIMQVANDEVSRDNPEMLFVTLFAAILDLRSGEMQYCNAGHDNPYRLLPSRPEPGRLENGDGPPLCSFAEFPYKGACCQLLPGEMLCLMTDGVTEAQNPAQDLYGTARAEQLLCQQSEAGTNAHELVTALQADVLAFAAGAEPADDLTILALRWNGPER